MAEYQAGKETDLNKFIGQKITSYEKILKFPVKRIN